LLAGEQTYLLRVLNLRLFQSTPAIAGGRTGAKCPGQITHIVSIHARHCWRANINPDVSLRLAWLVSIHARHCWRANATSPTQKINNLMFQSTPAIAGGRTNAADRLRRAAVVSIHARHCWRANL